MLFYSLFCISFLGKSLCTRSVLGPEILLPGKRIYSVYDKVKNKVPFLYHQNLWYTCLCCQYLSYTYLCYQYLIHVHVPLLSIPLIHVPLLIHVLCYQYLSYTYLCYTINTFYTRIFDQTKLMYCVVFNREISSSR